MPRTHLRLEPGTPGASGLGNFATLRNGQTQSQQNTTRHNASRREYSLDEDVNSVEVEERLKGYVRQNEDGKQVKMEAGFQRRVAQEFEVAGLEIGTLAARKRASGVWEEENWVGESAPITDAFAARDHNTREREKDEEKGKGDKWRGTGITAYPRRRLLSLAPDGLRHQHQHDHHSQRPWGW